MIKAQLCQRDSLVCENDKEGNFESEEEDQFDVDNGSVLEQAIGTPPPHTPSNLTKTHQWAQKANRQRFSVTLLKIRLKSICIFFLVYFY